MRFDENDSFVAFSSPGSSHFKLVYQHDKSTSQVPDHSVPHFIIDSFIKESGSSQAILAENVRLNERFSIDINRKSNGYHTEKDDYLKDVVQIIDDIKAEKFEKLVYSRKLFHRVTGDRVFEVFNQLKTTYPDVFVFCYHIPTRGCWIGATPEVLVKKNCDDFATTMALAGTQVDMGIPIEAVEWGVKEINEQAFLKEFVNRQLSGSKCSFSIISHETIKAGNVLHICSTFKIDIGAYTIQQIGNMLHPGPAISGTPMKTAIDYIKKYESHDREDYCGYLGPMNIDGESSLFINLRSMKVFKNGYSLFLGGGITKDSNAEAEWKETEDKSMTLLNIIENSYSH